MLGRGIVHPLDFDHDANPPSHPELLDLLTDEFIAHAFDVKWLVREIALSDTYQRSSVVPPGLTDPPADRYLAAGLKPLSPEQMAYAVSAATETLDIDLPAVEGRLAARVGQFRAVYAAAPGEPDDGAAATIDQTLFLKFGAVFRDLTASRAGGLADRLTKRQDAAALADDLFVSVLSRPPTAEETAAVAAALDGAEDRPALVRELVWALIASGEFRFNH